MKNAFLNNNDMSQYDQDIINQALGFLKEDNKRFVKIVTAKKNVVAAESDIKIISENKFYPVQYWLDTVTDPKQLKVLKELNYSSELYLNWWDFKFELFISKKLEMSEIFNKSDVRLGGKSLREFGKELVEKTDIEPFYDVEQHDAVNQLMSVLLSEIYLSLSASPTFRSSETPEDTTTTETGDSSIPPVSSELAPPVSSELAPPVADVTTMEPAKSDGAIFVKGHAKLVQICTSKMQKLNPTDKLIFFGSQTFNFDNWWKSLPKRYSGTKVAETLEESLELYIKNPEYDSAKGVVENAGVEFYILAEDFSVPGTTIASLRKNKFIKIAAEPEKSFDEILDEILDDFMVSIFGSPPELETPSLPGEVYTDEAPKSDLLEDKTPEQKNAKITFVELGDGNLVSKNEFLDIEKKDVIVLQESLFMLINKLFSAMLTIENRKKKQQVDNANNIAEQLQNTMDFTSSIYQGLGKSNLPNYKSRTRGKL